MKYISLIAFSLCCIKIININAGAIAAKTGTIVAKGGTLFAKKLGADTAKQLKEANDREEQFRQAMKPAVSKNTTVKHLEKEHSNFSIISSEMQNMISKAINNSFNTLQSAVNFIDKKSKKNLNTENMNKIKAEFVKNTLHSITGFIHTNEPLESNEDHNIDKNKNIFENNHRDLVKVF